MDVSKCFGMVEIIGDLGGLNKKERTAQKQVSV